MPERTDLNDQKAIPETMLDSAESWVLRRRVSARKALRYTRFVTVMRHLLPSLAVGILVVVLVYALYPRGGAKMSLSYENVQKVDGDLTMLRPRLSGTDAKGNPYLITAKSAVQSTPDARKVSLTAIDADLQYSGQSWANATSAKGYVDLDGKVMNMTGGMAIYTDSGYEMHTQSAFADLNKNVVVGKTPVSGQGPMGTFRADSFYIDRGKRHVTLQGHVRMKFYPKQVKQKVKK